jgi:hypothetical protein
VTVSKKNDGKEEVTASSETQQLIEEKIKLATELGIWGSFNPVEGYQDTQQYKRINEIDQRLSEIING